MLTVPVRFLMAGVRQIQAGPPQQRRMFLFVGLGGGPRIDEPRFGNLKKRDGDHHNYNMAAPESPNRGLAKPGSWTQPDPRHVVYLLRVLESVPAPPLSRNRSKLALSPPIQAQE